MTRPPEICPDSAKQETPLPHEALDVLTERFLEQQYPASPGEIAADVPALERSARATPHSKAIP